jgi:hypothetical protein
VETGQAGAGPREKIATGRGNVRDFPLDTAWQICHSHSIRVPPPAGAKSHGAFLVPLPRGASGLFPTRRPNPHIKATGGGLARKLLWHTFAAGSRRNLDFAPRALCVPLAPSFVYYDSRTYNLQVGLCRRFGLKPSRKFN